MTSTRPFLARSWPLTALLGLASGCSGPRSETAPAEPAVDAPAKEPGASARETATERDAPDTVATAETPPSDEVHGQLREHQGQRILRVWGTPEQMGHAHGYWLRDSILEIVDGYALDVIPPSMLDTAGTLYSTVAHVPPRLKREAEGIVAGMKAAGGAHIERLDRDLRASDLLVLNAMTDLLSIGCSSVSAWGSSTEAAPQLHGAPIMVRNLDWSEDEDLLRNQVIFVFEPEAADRQPVVSVAFAGYIGCLSCMNEAGVSALFNMGYGDGAASLGQAMGGFAPANLLLRDTLERRDIDSDGTSTSDDLQATWDEVTHAGSYILHVLEPRRSDGREPARVLEVEADGVVTRGASDAPVLGATMLAATNHLRRKTKPEPCPRYRNVERTAERADHRFDRSSLWRLGTTVRLPEVVHTVAVEPESRTLGVWLRGVGQTRADGTAPVVHTWSSLTGAALAP